MASAERTTVTKEVTTTVEEPVIRLELTERQANVILAMTGRVRGDLSSTYRKEVMEVRAALRSTDLYVWSGDYFDDTLNARLASTPITY